MRSSTLRPAGSCLAAWLLGFLILGRPEAAPAQAAREVLFAHQGRVVDIEGLMGMTETNYVASISKMLSWGDTNRLHTEYSRVFGVVGQAYSMNEINQLPSRLARDYRFSLGFRLKKVVVQLLIERGAARSFHYDRAKVAEAIERQLAKDIAAEKMLQSVKGEKNAQNIERAWLEFYNRWYPDTPAAKNLSLARERAQWAVTDAPEANALRINLFRANCLYPPQWTRQHDLRVNAEVANLWYEVRTRVLPAIMEQYKEEFCALQEHHQMVVLRAPHGTDIAPLVRPLQKLLDTDREVSPRLIEELQNRMLPQAKEVYMATWVASPWELEQDAGLTSRQGGRHGLTRAGIFPTNQVVPPEGVKRLNAFLGGMFASSDYPVFPQFSLQAWGPGRGEKTGSAPKNAKAATDTQWHVWVSRPIRSSADRFRQQSVAELLKDRGGGFEDFLTGKHLGKLYRDLVGTLTQVNPTYFPSQDDVVGLISQSGMNSVLHGQGNEFIKPID